MHAYGVYIADRHYRSAQVDLTTETSYRQRSLSLKTFRNLSILGAITMRQ